MVCIIVNATRTSKHFSEIPHVSLLIAIASNHTPLVHYHYNHHKSLPKMAKSLLTTLALLTLTATPALSACSGGHTFGACADRIVHWYDPATGEICDPLDCGGGRAPVKTDVPGCAAYKGTLTRPTEASYMPCFTSGVLVTTTVEELPEPVTTTLKTATTTTTTAVVVVVVPNSSAGGQADETDSAGAGASSASEKASPSEDAGENGGDSTTTGAASASTPLTTAPPVSTPPAGAGAGAGSGGDEAGSSSTTVSEGAGSAVGASWIAAAAGVALGALGVL
jgi:hypothetical protein